MPTIQSEEAIVSVSDIPFSCDCHVCDEPIEGTIDAEDYEGIAAIEFEVWCGTCGTGLCNLTKVEGSGVTIDACPNCMEREREEGKEAGEQDARREMEDEA